MTKYENLPEAGLLSARHEADAVPRTSSQTITRVDLAEAVYRSVGLSRKESAILVQTVLDELGEALIAGEAVKLSSFGRFVVREKPERVGRNPKTGIAVPITQRRVLSFKPSSVLKARINGIAAPDEED
ncbi:integration host factor subunit alpha [Methylocapsa sp. D3K7]|uniref:integration host factor subunit alpha n=1 Tax=Methylocapsa sp. D3K7 TaxID=3041435 RepID=UPI00244E8D95|nr:integration host factor subunit alpha [Methylocapsa sp. D3K7]WGJ15989.1 integration host factor subunit alpha [Methylocapsa sp. D3K7]